MKNYVWSSLTILPCYFPEQLFLNLFVMQDYTRKMLFFIRVRLFLPLCTTKSDTGPVMEEFASTVLEITGGKHQSVKWPGNGFWLTIPAGAVPEGTTISLAVRAFLVEGFQLPENCQLISAVYWIATSQRFEQEITLHLHVYGTALSSNLMLSAPSSNSLQDATRQFFLTSWGRGREECSLHTPMRPPSPSSSSQCMGLLVRETCLLTTGDRAIIDMRWRTNLGSWTTPSPAILILLWQSV